MPISPRRRLAAIAVASALAIALAPLAVTGSAVAAPADFQTVDIVNGDSNGATLRFDVNGDAIDAHDGEIQKFGDTYYLYGTVYGCGFAWKSVSGRFCGIGTYSSPDLVNWTPEGQAFDATTDYWQDRCDAQTIGCFRPHVVFNESTEKYVMWMNSYDVGVGYHVFTADEPAGPFTEVDIPVLGADPGPPGGVNYGDHDIFIDDDNTAYLAFTDWRVGGDILVEKLDASYTSGTGEFVRLGLNATEAPAIFEREGRYYMTYSDPNRGYQTTGTAWVEAPSPLGPWTGSSVSPSSWTVSGGVLAIDGGGTGLSRIGSGWTDYTVEATVTPQLAGAGGYAQTGITFRASDAGTSYSWLIGNYPYPQAPGGNLTRVISGPGGSTTTVPLGVNIVTGQSYDVAITVAGTTITTSIDGVVVDTTTSTVSANGRIGFRESGGNDRERTLVDDVTVTAADGTVLLADDFSGGLAKWDRPAATIVGWNITTTSCGGQPTSVLPLETPTGTEYLYMSDVWNFGAANQSLANYHWEPLRFDGAGNLLPIQCGASYQLQIPAAPAGRAVDRPALGSGDAGFRAHHDVFGTIARAQTFTADETGTLSEVRFTSSQVLNPVDGLELSVVRVLPDGSFGAEVAARTATPAQVSWSPSWVSIPLDIEVEAGDEFAIVISTSSTGGRYGIAYTDTNPYPGGGALFSNTGGATWVQETGRDLHFEADIDPAVPLNPTGSLSKTEVAAGGTVDISLAGFEPGENLAIELRGPGGGAVRLAAAQALASRAADSNGALTATLTIPTNAALGASTIVVTGQSSRATVTLSVRVIAAAAVPGGGAGGGAGGLVTTGVDASVALWTAALLLLTGGALLGVRRLAAHRAE